VALGPADPAVREEIEIVLWLALPVPWPAEVRLPRHTLHHASVPGQVTARQEGDVWAADPPEPVGPIRLELVPPAPFLRTAAFASVRAYLYTPNLLAVCGLLGLSSVTSLLLPTRSRRVPLSGPALAGPPGGAGDGGSPRG
jgi:hypothetical protein